MHYVCSDIHGRWNRYEAMLKGLNLGREDRLYILGDVIDRGEDGIPILLDLMDRENVTFFLGNHEMFLLAVFETGDEEWMDTWLFNGGGATAEDFLALEKERQERLLEFLRESWAVMPDLLVGEKTLKLLTGMGRKVIIGHTVTKYFAGGQLREGEKPRIYHSDMFTCIDCGCAMKGDRGQLGVLRLEDGAEFYF